MSGKRKGHAIHLASAEQIREFNERDAAHAARLAKLERAVIDTALDLHKLRVMMGNINPDDPFDAACAALAAERGG